jgi:hypothetical protein
MHTPNFLIPALGEDKGSASRSSRFIREESTLDTDFIGQWAAHLFLTRLLFLIFCDQMFVQRIPKN